MKEIKYNERQREINEIMQMNLKSNMKAKSKPRLEVQFLQPQQQDVSLKPSLKDSKLRVPLQVSIQRQGTVRPGLNSKTPGLKPPEAGVGTHLALVSQKTSIMKQQTIRDSRRKTALVPQPTHILSEDEEPNPQRTKKVVQAYKNSKLTGQHQFLNWLVAKLPENTRARIEDIYEDVFAGDDDEVIRNKRRGRKRGAEQERFYRVIEDESDKIPVIGNARPQETFNTRIDDEEYGSVLLFKVPRACRKHNHNHKFNHAEDAHGMNFNDSYLNDADFFATPDLRTSAQFLDFDRGSKVNCSRMPVNSDMSVNESDQEHQV